MLAPGRKLDHRRCRRLGTSGVSITVFDGRNINNLFRNGTMRVVSVGGLTSGSKSGAMTIRTFRNGGLMLMSRNRGNSDNSI